MEYKGRKTIGVNQIHAWANIQLARTDEYADLGFKSGIATMLERILLDSDNYEGYSHLYKDDCEINTLGYFSRKYW